MPRSTVHYANNGVYISSNKSSFSQGIHASFSPQLYNIKTKGHQLPTLHRSLANSIILLTQHRYLIHCFVLKVLFVYFTRATINQLWCVTDLSPWPKQYGWDFDEHYSRKRQFCLYMLPINWMTWSSVITPPNQTALLSGLQLSSYGLEGEIK